MSKPYKTYVGGKSGSGVYQALINLIPPHQVFISGFLGNCAVFQHMMKFNRLKLIGLDADRNVVIDWRKKNEAHNVYVYHAEGLGLLKLLICDHIKWKSFVFLDPPYLDEVRSTVQQYYKHDMRTIDEHSEFLNMVLEHSHMANIMITHYPCELYNTMLKGWNHVDINTRTRGKTRVTRIYMNYPTPTELQDYTFFGKTFREREKYKRITNNLKLKINRLSPLERNYILKQIHDEYFTK